MKLLIFHVQALEQILADPGKQTGGTEFPIFKTEIEQDRLKIEKTVCMGRLRLNFLSGGLGFWNQILEYQQRLDCPQGQIVYQMGILRSRFGDPEGEEGQLAQALVDTLARLGYGAPRYTDND